jgi:hypothetical protein
MKRALLIFLALATVAVTTAGSGSAAPPKVDLRGTWNCLFTNEPGSCTFTITQMDLATGAFSGTGSGNDVFFVVSGTLDGLNLAMQFGRTNGVGTYTFTGTVDSADTHMTGTAHLENSAVPDEIFDFPRLDGGPPPSGAASEPASGKTVVIGDIGGTSRYRRPGSSAFVTLGADRAIPTGSEIDVKKGTLALSSAAGGAKADQTAIFNGGIFKVNQSKGSALTTLKLTEPLACPRAASASKARHRKLFGSGHGAFRTQGHFGSATVRGTRWTVDDTCTTTKLTVLHGRVSFLDLVKHKTISVTTGHSYTARAR